ncbi:CDI toxin immunity protein, partial [Serratia sp. IR-2025]
YNKSYDVFVFVDDINIPIFRANLMLVAENIYDVTALSPKMFIFNNELILQPLFPTEIIRLGIKD